MGLDRSISRLSRIFVDDNHVGFPEAEGLLRAMTLEIVVGNDAISPAAHAAILTAVSVGRRSFPGGVRVTGAIDQPLNSSVPVAGSSLREAAGNVGAETFEGPVSRTLVIGQVEIRPAGWAVGVAWSGWRARTADVDDLRQEHSENPLVGIAAGALAVGRAFDAERGVVLDRHLEIDLWPGSIDSAPAPEFSEVYLPGAVWLIGLGNLGQAFLWALTALPYRHPGKVTLVLQDADKISEENWATSVLARQDNTGILKTRVAESWALEKGFDVFRVDKKAAPTDRLERNHPCIALCGVDKISSRRLLAGIGFECIVDAGLGRTSKDFDRYRVTVFDKNNSIDRHFDEMEDPPAINEIPSEEAYQKLLGEIGRCGAVEVAGASVAAPYVSALAATIATSRLIAISSNCPCPANEVAHISTQRQRSSPSIQVDVRGSRHAGRPSISGVETNY